MPPCPTRFVRVKRSRKCWPSLESDIGGCDALPDPMPLMIQIPARSSDALMRNAGLTVFLLCEGRVGQCLIRGRKSGLCRVDFP
jgi:hypothetical protein